MTEIFSSNSYRILFIFVSKEQKYFDSLASRKAVRLAVAKVPVRSAKMKLLKCNIMNLLFILRLDQ